MASTGDAARRHSKLWAYPIRKDGEIVEPEGWPDVNKEHALKVEAALKALKETGDKTGLAGLGLVPAPSASPGSQQQPAS